MVKIKGKFSHPGGKVLISLWYAKALTGWCFLEARFNVMSRDSEHALVKELFWESEFSVAQFNAAAIYVFDCGLVFIMSKIWSHSVWLLK